MNQEPIGMNVFSSIKKFLGMLATMAPGFLFFNLVM
jgi:hypothetical protein